MADSTAFFGYTTGLVSLPVSSSEVPNAIPIENTFDFVWTDAMYSCDNAAVMAGNDVTFGGALVNVADAAKQNRIFKFPVPITHVFGTPGVGSGWFRLPFMMRFPGNGNITIYLTNLLGVTLNLRLSLLGFQVEAGRPIPI